MPAKKPGFLAGIYYFITKIHDDIPEIDFVFKTLYNETHDGQTESVLTLAI
jgi:hypothetical protein